MVVVASSIMAILGRHGMAMRDSMRTVLGRAVIAELKKESIPRPLLTGRSCARRLARIVLPDLPMSGRRRSA